MVTIGITGPTGAGKTTVFSPSGVPKANMHSSTVRSGAPSRCRMVIYSSGSAIRRRKVAA